MVTRSQQIEKGYDCVVIGAGNGGLAAAARLAVAGVRVLLLEQHNLPGGFATSFVRGRFEFEAALHELADIGSPTLKGNVRQFFEDDLGVYLDWVEVPEAFRYIQTDPRGPMDVTMPYGEQAFIDALEKAEPGSRASITRYVALCKDVLDGLNYVGQSRGNPDKKRLLTEYSALLKTAPYSIDQVAKALKVPERARKILQAQWTYIGPPPEKLSFTIFGAMLYKFLTRSAWIPRQRSHELSLSIVERIRELGGDVQFNTRATEIQVHDGQIVGVRTSKGDTIETQHVISNASPTLIYNQLIAPKFEVPKITLQACNARRYGVSGMVVYMGLDATLSDLGLNEYSYMIYDSIDDNEVYRSFGALDTPKTQAALCLNNALPDCSPPGTSIVSLTTLLRAEAWRDVKPQDYVKVKNRIADGLIRNFERATSTSLHDHIEEFEVATPQTFARYTGNYDGIIYGYEPEPWDSLLPRMMMMEEDQYFNGLHFCGGYAFRCTGYSSTFLSGQTAALLTLRDLKEGR
jgi:phytoene dehydrogenase-like protein